MQTRSKVTHNEDGQKGKPKKDGSLQMSSQNKATTMGQATFGFQSVRQARWCQNNSTPQYMGPKEDGASTTRLNTNLGTKESSPRDILSRTKVSKAKKKAKMPNSYKEGLSKA